MTEEEFRTFFEPYGAISDSVVMLDRLTGRSRGFGFVTFEDESDVQKIFDSDPQSKESGAAKLVMRGKTCEVKRAVPRDGSSKQSANHRQGHKPRHDIRHGPNIVPTPVFDTVPGAGFIPPAQMTMPYQSYAYGDENWYHAYTMSPYEQSNVGVYSNVEPIPGVSPYYAPPAQYHTDPYYGAVPTAPISPVPQGHAGTVPAYPPAAQFPPPPPMP